MQRTDPQRISVVIPVYAAERTLPTLLEEIVPLTEHQTSPAGNTFVISEVLLVHDCGPDRSDLTLEALSARYPFVQAIWLSRNYGQHAATMAGMAFGSAFLGMCHGMAHTIGALCHVAHGRTNSILRRT